MRVCSWVWTRGHVCMCTHMCDVLECLQLVKQFYWHKLSFAKCSSSHFGERTVARLILGEPQWKNHEGSIKMQEQLCFDYPTATSHICWCPEISLFDHLYWLRRLLIQRCGGGRIFPNPAMSHPKINYEFEVERSNNIFPLAHSLGKGSHDPLARELQSIWRPLERSNNENTTPPGLFSVLEWMSRRTNPLTSLCRWGSWAPGQGHIVS